MIAFINKKLDLLGSDFKHVIVGSGVTFLLKVFGVFLSFLVTILLSRILSIESLGTYFIILSFLMIGSTIVRCGVDNAVLKYVGTAYVSNDWESIHGIYKISLIWTTLGSICLHLGLYFSAEFIALDIFKVKELQPILEVLGLVIFPMALYHLHVFFFQAMQKIKSSALLLGILLPVFMILGIYVLSVNDVSSVEYFVYLYGLNCLLLLLISIYFFKRLASPMKLKQGSFSSRMLWLTSLPMFGAITTDLFAKNGPQLILGVYWSPEDVAVFSVSMRIATLIGFILTSASRVIAPKLSVLYSKGDMKGLRTLAKSTTMIFLLMAFGLAATLIIWPAFFLGLFGSEFANKSEVLQIYVVAQLILVVYGIGIIVLQMTGLEKISNKVSFMNVLMIFVLSLFLIPEYSAMGTVLAILISAVFSTLAIIISIKKKLGFYLVGPG